MNRKDLPIRPGWVSHMVRINVRRGRCKSALPYQGRFGNGQTHYAKSGVRDCQILAEKRRFRLALCRGFLAILPRTILSVRGAEEGREDS